MMNMCKHLATVGKKPPFYQEEKPVRTRLREGHPSAMLVHCCIIRVKDSLSTSVNFHFKLINQKKRCNKHSTKTNVIIGLTTTLLSVSLNIATITLLLFFLFFFWLI